MKIDREEIKKYWLTLKPFVVADDVPSLPNPFDDFFIDLIVKLGAIPKNELEDGVWYYGDYRNTDLGKWNAQKSKFDIWRYKFGYRRDDCNHFEDDDGYALFVPLRKATEEEINFYKDLEK